MKLDSNGDNQVIEDNELFDLEEKIYKRASYFRSIQANVKEEELLLELIKQYQDLRADNYLSSETQGEMDDLEARNAVLDDRVGELEGQTFDVVEQIRTIRKAVANDGAAITYQTMGHYRDALIKLIDGILGGVE